MIRTSNFVLRREAETEVEGDVQTLKAGVNLRFQFSRNVERE